MSKYCFVKKKKKGERHKGNELKSKKGQNETDLRRSRGKLCGGKGDGTRPKCHLPTGLELLSIPEATTLPV